MVPATPGQDSASLLSFPSPSYLF